MNIETGERVESELDAMISRRDKQRRRDEGERAAEALYAESCREHEDRERLRELWEHLRYHRRMVRSHTANLEAIVGRHRLEVAWYEALLGIGAGEEDA